MTDLLLEFHLSFLFKLYKPVLSTTSIVIKNRKNEAENRGFGKDYKLKLFCVKNGNPADFDIIIQCKVQSAERIVWSVENCHSEGAKANEESLCHSYCLTRVYPYTQS